MWTETEREYRKARLPKHKTCCDRRSGQQMLPLLCLLLAIVGGVLSAQAQTPSPSDSTDDPNLTCLYNTTGSVWTDRQTIPLGESVTVRWSVQVPYNCTTVAQTLNSQSVPRSGSITVYPPANASYVLRARFSGATRILASAAVAVGLPVVNGRPTVTITSNDQAPLFVQALGTDNALIYVQNHVELDLSYREYIPIHTGVTVIGGRTAQVPGARLYTQTFPKQLFRIGGLGVPGNDVRITGLRIQGAEMGVADADADGSTGISIRSWTNIEIDNNEIYGWRGSGVEVLDDDNRIGLALNAMTVRIHDNFIHHNQHQQKHGYGVSVGNGAYALIEKNVFDWNRHAIAGDGSDGSGYLAYRNLVLENGGLTFWVLGTWAHTHMFDMHGQEDCWLGDRNCGRAGEYMDIRYNTFLYNAGHAFRLRGTPSIRADVRDNAFKHESLWGVFTPYETLPGAVTQSESGLVPANNQLGVDESGNYGYCDFDGDGAIDTFFATGATWWFSSGGTSAWRYLNTSTRRLSQLTLGDFDGDGRCDVRVGGVISSGGTGPWRPRAGGIVWRNTDGRFALWSLNGGTIVGEVYRADVGNSWQVRGTGDFNGDRSDDILWRNTSGQVAIWHMSRLNQLSTVYPGNPVAADWRIQGTGDFDGDGLSDILWRNESGQLAIWFKGDPYDRLYPTVFPGYHNVPEPVGLEWQVVGVGDFNCDGRSDILWRHTNGQVAIWHMAGGVRISDHYPGIGVPTLLWTIAGVGDFDADGRADILWRDVSGAVAIWLGGEAERVVYPSYGNGGAPVDPAWRIEGATDYNSDGRTDILWRHTDGQLAIWFMAGGRYLGDAHPRTVEASWEIEAVFSHPR
jgi:hypothetical protein